jgi:hypothetical protein
VLVVLPEKWKKITLKLPGFKNHVALDAFTRSDLAATKRSADGGLGVFLTAPDHPTRVTGGLVASWNDGKGRVALVASYTF